MYVQTDRSDWMTRPQDHEFELDCLSTIEDLAFLILQDMREPARIAEYVRELREMTASCRTHLLNKETGALRRAA